MSIPAATSSKEARSSEPDRPTTPAEEAGRAALVLPALARVGRARSTYSERSLASGGLRSGAGRQRMCSSLIGAFWVNVLSLCPDRFLSDNISPPDLL